MDKNELFKLLPKVDELIEESTKIVEFKGFSKEFRTNIIRETLDTKRAEISDGTITEKFGITEVLRDIHNHLQKKIKHPIRRAINATGIILHTNMGRAVVPDSARDAILDVLSYSTLEVDVETGKRGNRLDKLEPLLCELTGAEGAVVVNNNAAATLLILAEMTNHGEEVIVARGQLVEIGGSFRLPEVMAQAGVTLREIGTTNKVHYHDYENAINDKTAALMKIHPSNFKIIGFTSEVPVIELSKIGKKYNLPVIDDLGAGAYADISTFGYDPEPLVRDSIRDGADIVCSSGDKLVGGIQAGIIVGKSIWINKLRKHPLYRALRCDKITLAGLHACLQLFLDPDNLSKKNPTWFMMSMTDEQTMEIAKIFAKTMKNTVKGLEIQLKRGFSELGSGSLPEAQIPTGLVAFKTEKLTVEELARNLRLNEPPVFTRIEDERVIIDVRTLQPGDHEIILQALNRIINNDSHNKTTKRHYS